MKRKKDSEGNMAFEVLPFLTPVEKDVTQASCVWCQRSCRMPERQLQTPSRR